MRTRAVRVGRWLGMLALLTACGSKEDNSQPTPNPTPADAACVDRPGSLPRPPARGLPCELIPPGRQR